MTTDISVSKTNYQSENRSWLVTQPGAVGQGYTPGCTLDASLFTAGTHFPNGYLPSGTVLGKNTTTGLYGPFDPAASDGRQTAAGILYSSVRFATATAKVGGARVVAFAVVLPSKLPFQSGTGSLTAAAQTSLRNIHFAA